MLNDNEINKYLKLHNLSPEAIEYIESVRSTPPSRMVGVHAKTNICSQVYSKKMEHTITVESYTVEKAVLLKAEWDPYVLEIWEQPEPVRINRTNKNSVKRPLWYTADFLVFNKSGPVAIEAKTLKFVQEKIEKGDPDWVLDSSGIYQFLPAQERYAEMGIGFEVVTHTKELMYLATNIELILLSREQNCEIDLIAKNVMAALEQSSVWKLAELKKELGLDSYTGLIQLVDRGLVSVNLKTQLLNQPDVCHVFSCEVLMLAAGSSDSWLYQEIDRSRIPSSREVNAAIERLSQIRSSSKKNRTVRRWEKSVKDGEREGRTELQSLLPMFYKRGNRQQKISSQVDDFLVEYLLNDYAKARGISDYRSYIGYRIKASEQHPYQEPVSRQTFIARKLQLPPEQIAFLRGGKRAANREASPSDPLERALKPQLAWQTVAIDHGLADLFTIFFFGQDYVYVDRPWITVMVDLFTGMVLAFSISYQPPSRRSVCKVFRDCVHRWGKLPNAVIVDRGAEFKSVYMASLLAHYKVELLLRPASHPRYGGEVEGFFGEFMRQWLSGRPGNVTDKVEARSIDGKKAPRNVAILHPADLFKELTAFCEWRNHKLRGAHTESCRYKFDKSVQEFPFIARDVAYDAEFLLSTAVETKDYKVDFQRGLHIGDRWYYSPKINQIRGYKSKLEVRIDPEDPFVVYALIQDRWTPCTSTGANLHQAKDRINKLVEGLNKLEAYAQRRKLKVAQDEEMRGIQHQMDEVRHHSGLTPMLDLEGFDEASEDSIYEQLVNVAVKPLAIHQVEV